jgi:uncharacterized protein YukJ
MNTQTFSSQAQKEIDNHSGMSDKQSVSFAYETKNSDIIDIVSKYLKIVATPNPESILIVSSNIEDSDENITTHLFTYFLVNNRYIYVGDVEKFLRSEIQKYMSK